MAITAADVNTLRKQTGAGIMDCKNALNEANGDFEKAVEILRKKGQKVAANRSDRDSKEGVVICKINSNNSFGVLLSLNCETDFVAMNLEFVKLANEIIDIAIKENKRSKEELLSSRIDDMTIYDKLIEQTGVIGEKIEIGYFETIKAEFVGGYIHSGNKISSIVGLNKVNNNSTTISKDVAMQIAAMNPVALDENGVSKEMIDKEIEIAKEQLRNEGKAEDMLEKIAKGKLVKFFKENTLLNQEFIKDNKITVKEYLQSFDKELTVKEFKRYSI